MAIQRWTDEMLDDLASSVAELRGSVTELRGSVAELRGSMDTMRDSINTLRDSVETVQDSVDGLRITTQALLQVAAQSQRDMELLRQRQAENDVRFNILLEEVRYLRRQNDRRENGESGEHS